MKKNGIILLLTIIGLSQLSFAQTKKRNYKTLNEISYSINDSILPPAIIYYDSRLDKKGEDSAKLIADFLIAHPTFKVEISVHADGRGSDKYNFTLTEYRAESLVRFLNSKYNIPFERMVARGYGNKYVLYPVLLIRKEKDTAKKAEMHLANNRTEIKIISVK